MTTESRTRYTVLGMLTIENLSGYEMIKIIKSSTNHFWSESEGQIYPTLAKCVKDGLATCKEYSAEKSGRPKKIYSITEKGKKELTAWLKKEVNPCLIRNELLLKLFFGKNIPMNDNIHHIVHHKKQIESELIFYKKIRTEIAIEHEKSPHLKYWLMTIDYGIEISKAELAWCKKTLKTLR
ncbi:MAG TPA: PadR family transcriptional regulator [Gammaproteobacteria bacterium]|nr:PadR family transcriptional regulator [Gammaproteobacteria bacterium]